MSNLRLLSDENLVDGVSTFSATDVFSADYTNYKVTISNLSHNDGNPAQISFRFIDSTGTVVSNSQYDTAVYQTKSDASYSEIKGTNENDTRLMGYADFSPEASGFVIDIFNPFSSSYYTSMIVQSGVAVSGAYYGQKGIAILTELKSITGLQVIASSNTLDSGNMKVYGLRVDT